MALSGNQSHKLLVDFGLIWVNLAIDRVAMHTLLAISYVVLLAGIAIGLVWQHIHSIPDSAPGIQKRWRYWRKAAPASWHSKDTSGSDSISGSETDYSLGVRIPFAATGKPVS